MKIWDINIYKSNFQKNLGYKLKILKIHIYKIYKNKLKVRNEEVFEQMKMFLGG